MSRICNTDGAAVGCSAERLKEELGLLKVVVGISLAAEFSTIAWLGQNYSHANPLLFWLGMLAASKLLVALVATGRWMYTLLRKLEYFA